MAGTGTVVIFPSAQHLFDLSFGQIFADIHRTYQGSGHNPFMFKRQFKQDGDPLICSFLILTGHVKEDIFPPGSPVVRETGRRSLRPFGQQEKLYPKGMITKVAAITMPTIAWKA